MSQHESSPPPRDDWPPQQWRRLEHLAELALDLAVELDTPPADEFVLIAWRALRTSRGAADPHQAYLNSLPLSQFRRERDVQAAVGALERADEVERVRIRRELIIHYLPVAAQHAHRTQAGSAPFAEAVVAATRALVDMIEAMPPIPAGTTPFRVRVAATVLRAMASLRADVAAARAADGQGDEGPEPSDGL